MVRTKDKYFEKMDLPQSSNCFEAALRAAAVSSLSTKTDLNTEQDDTKSSKNILFNSFKESSKTLKN